ncbi:MAG: carbohydrate ABC transporter substrate-binding protein [Geminicoccaceae bacterium]|nr:carbohydrate ABC transporter substrate-binding protein [Geminicoccaceae bacterium]
MSKLRQAMMAGCLSLSIAFPVAAEEMKAEVIHWWTSGGESAAIKTFADEFTARGGTWIDQAIAGGENARTQGINRIIGGNPPTAMQLNTGKQFDELVEADLLRNLDDIAEAGHWRDNLPKVIADAATRNGSFYAAPINIHGQNWFFYNAEVFANAGIEPPTTFAELVEDGKALRDAGVIPLALGGQSWQERLTFNAVLLGVGGRDTYFKVLRDKDVDTVHGDAFRKVVETYGSMRDLVDEGSPGRNWNDATAMVINGKAAVQIMGDWAKGEFIAAGMTPDKEYGCNIISPDEGFIIGGDVFVFPVVEGDEQNEAQRVLATLMMEPGPQVAFNEKKGSIPVLLNVDVSGMDVCAQKAMALLQNSDQQIPSSDFLVSPDIGGALQDAITQFWNAPEMSVDEFVDLYSDALQSGF